MIPGGYEKHFPVMLKEVLAAMNPQDGETYVDATFGNGGYTEALLKAADCKVIALDRDPNVKARADELRAKYGNRFEFRAGQFSHFSELVTEPVNGAVFDIGVSSMQLDNGERGFSFSKDAPLDMRMSCSGTSAADLVNSLAENDLADLIYKYGEERKSRQIASKIVEARKSAPITTTKQLAEIIYGVIHKTPNGIDPATRTFQALRIAVNNELEELEEGLKGAAFRLAPKGRLVIVTFHSLEDRIAKAFFKENSGPNVHVSKYAKNVPETENGAIFAETSKAVAASKEETTVNKRSRSAKLRWGIKK